MKMRRRLNAAVKNVLSPFRKHNKYLKAAVLLSAAIFSFSCTTVSIQDEVSSNSQLLPEESNIVIKADLEPNKELVNSVVAAIDSPSVTNIQKKFLNRTDSVWAGITLDETSEGTDSFNGSFIFEGRYPSSIISIGMANDSWTKDYFVSESESTKRLKYWKEKEGNIQVAVPQNDLLCVSTGNIDKICYSILERDYTPVSSEWLNFERNSDIAIMVKNLEPQQFASFVPEFKKIPLESVFLSMRKIQSSYDITGIFHMENEINAALFTALFKIMVLSAKTETGEKMFKDRKAVNIEKKGKDVVVTGMLLPTETITSIVINWCNQAEILPVN
ncbi:MAG: hypothetical protein PQJ46_03245 [Spirochaetales bacterium]|nr:hypothetical protein [Spirochaetales bacterium]